MSEPLPPQDGGDDEVESLVRDLARLAQDAPGKLAQRVAALPLKQQAELALRLSSKERLELLLHAPQPMRLVRMLPDADLYFTVRDVGPSDALPLLALASAAQIRHVLDLESWRGDRFDADRAGAWVALLLEAGEPALLRFLRNSDDETLTLLFARWLRVRQIEIDDTPSIHGHGETEAGTEEGLLSPDGYYRFSPTIPSHASAARRIAEVFFHDDRERYERVLWGALYELPSEVEEQALYFRQSRLEEHGFPTWEEALSVYAPPAGAGAGHAPVLAAEPETLLAPREALRGGEERSALVRAMERLPAEPRERALLEVTAVANRLLVADGADTQDVAAHRAALEKASAYVGIALEARGARDAGECAGILAQVPIIELFREGFARAAEVQARARRLAAEGWLSVDPRAIEMLDEPIASRLRGLLGKRPFYFDPALRHAESPHRPFRSLQEIRETAVSVDLAETLGRVLGGALRWDLASLLRGLPGSADPPRLSMLFLTSLAWHEAGAGLRAGPLPKTAAESFLRGAGDPGAARRSLRGFVERIVRETGLGERAATELEIFGQASLAALAEEARPLWTEAEP